MTITSYNENPWEQRKLGEIGKIIAGGDKDSKKLRKKGKYPVLANNLENNGIIGYYKNNYKIEAPAITVTARGNIGNAIARFTNFTPVVRLLVLKTNLDVKFIEQSINNINFFIESTGVPQLTVPQLASYSIFIPKKFEQHKIGSLFKFIDNIVALYERKIKALKKLKQAIFEVLNSIPHKSNVYRISEIFDVTRGNVLSKKSISNKFSNMYPVYSSQTKNDGLLGYYSDYLFENSITWTTDGANAGTVKYRTGKFYCTNVCGVLLNSEGYCNEYTAEVIEKETPKFVSHVGNPKLMNNVMKQIKIKLPDVATQQSYSDILLTFDNVCTSFCNKLNDLNQIKNKLLNTMFI